MKIACPILDINEKRMSDFGQMS